MNSKQVKGSIIKMYFDEEAAKWDTERRIKRAKILSDVISEKIDYTKG